MSTGYQAVKEKQSVFPLSIEQDLAKQLVLLADILRSIRQKMAYTVAVKNQLNDYGSPFTANLVHRSGAGLFSN